MKTRVAQFSNMAVSHFPKPAKESLGDVEREREREKEKEKSRNYKEKDRERERETLMN